MSPILSDPERRPTHLEALRSDLAGLPNGTDSPLAAIPCIHMARLFIIPDVIYLGYPAQEDHLQSSYLMFGCEFDGTLDELLTLLTGRCPEVVDSVWSHCVGYPGLGNATELLNYFKQCQLNTSLFFGDSPDATAEEVRRALLVKREMTLFAQQNQSISGDKLRRGFRELVDRLRVEPTPPPGTP